MINEESDLLWTSRPAKKEDQGPGCWCHSEVVKEMQSRYRSAGAGGAIAKVQPMFSRGGAEEVRGGGEEVRGGRW